MKVLAAAGRREKYNKVNVSLLKKVCEKSLFNSQYKQADKK